MSQDASISLTMRSKKQHIRLWFECLQICHTQSEYKDNLKGSSDFYEEWGDVTQVKFDQWWKDKKYLFEDAYVRQVQTVSKNPNIITLSIPLNEKITVILSEVKRIVRQNEPSKLTEKYSFTQKEIKGVFHYVNLEMYKIYLRLNKPPINRKFLMEVRSSFDERPRSKLKSIVVTIPTRNQFAQNYHTNADCEDEIRMVRRSLKGVEKTLTNVSKGRFP
jgi:hypothetical protein